MFLRCAQPLPNEFNHFRTLTYKTNIKIRLKQDAISEDFRSLLCIIISAAKSGCTLIFDLLVPG